MTEEKHGFIHNLLFNLITKRYYKKEEKSWTGPKSLKRTISIQQTILEKQIKERWTPKFDSWDVIKAVFMLGLVLFVGFEMWQTLPSSIGGERAENATFVAEQALAGMDRFMGGFFSILAVLVIITVLISLVRVIASPFGEGDL
jgi:hypothetical protein